MTKYDIIICGSGNGCCGFLLNYNKPENCKILVIERGGEYQDLPKTFQQNWVDMYSTNTVQQVTSQSRNGNFITSYIPQWGGGGSSINYAQVFAPPQFFQDNIGYDIDYWKNLMKRCGNHFINNKISLSKSEETLNNSSSLSQCNEYISNIPVATNNKVYTLNNNFARNSIMGVNVRQNIGIKLINRDKYEFRYNTTVHSLQVNSTCSSVTGVILDSGEVIPLANDGIVIVAANTINTIDIIRNSNIDTPSDFGNNMGDHLLITCPPFITKASTDKQYLSTCFQYTDVMMQFIEINKYKVTKPFEHLYSSKFSVSYKKLLYANKWWFAIKKAVNRILILILELFLRWYNCNFILGFMSIKLPQNGKYNSDQTVVLNCTVDKFKIKNLYNDYLNDMNTLFKKPPQWFCVIWELLLKSTYTKERALQYITHNLDHQLLTQCHLSGGCLFDKCINQKGKFKGMNNLYICDSSTIPTPDCSPQMSVYLVGYHVAEQLNQK